MAALKFDKKIQLLIIILVTFLAYSNIFQNQYMIDDFSFITDWEQIRDLKNIPQLLTGQVPEVHQGVYRPVRSVLYALYYQIWGENPLGWHIHSIMVHLLSTVLVYLIIGRIMSLRDHKVAKQSSLSVEDRHGPPVAGLAMTTIPFFTALLFGLHPIHTESITYIAASMEMTGVVFFFASFYFYLQKRKYLSWLFAALALYTYEMTLTLPLLIVLYEVCFRKTQKNRHSERSAKNLPWYGKILHFVQDDKRAGAYFILAGSFIFIRAGLLNLTSRGDYLAYSFYHTQLTMLKVYVKYLQLLIFPYNISYLHELAPGFDSWMTKYNNLQSILNQSVFDLDILFSITVITFIIIIMIIARKKAPLVTFCLGWFFISLLPVSYIVPQGIAMGEKYLYIASFGIILLMVTLIFNFQIKIFNQFSIFKFSLVFLIAIAYGYLTYQRNLDWHDPISFWSKAEKQRPQNPLPTYNLALEYGNKGNQGQAERYYLKTIGLEPRFWEARFNLGNLYLKTGQASKAADLYKSVLQLNPGFEPAINNLNQVINQSSKSSPSNKLF